MKKILLFGIGQLGARYLEGIRDEQGEWMEIHLVEPNEQMIQDCIEKLKFKNGFLQKCKWHNSIDTVNGEFDLVAVITPAAPRPDIVSNIANKLVVKNWLLEKVLSTSLEGLDTIENKLGHMRAWVNTPRRLTSLYSALRARLPGRRISFDVNIKKFALGCNSIHFIDLLEWLTGETLVSIQVSASTGWFDAKRTGYKEFDGQVVAVYSAGSELRINNVCEPYSEGIFLSAGGSRIMINESHGFALNNKIFRGRVEYQSELSGDIIQQVLKSGTCNLPTLTTSLRQHRCFFRAILKNPKLKTLKGGIVPIT